MTDIKNKLAVQDANKRVRDIVYRGYVDIIPHCRKRMRERNYFDVDIESLLLDGRIKKEPEYNNDRKEWRYEVEGDIEGEPTVLVVAFPSDVRLKCITIYDIS